MLDIGAAPRRRSWRRDEEQREEERRDHLYVNLPERSPSYGGAAEGGGSEGGEMEGGGSEVKINMPSLIIETSSM